MAYSKLSGPTQLPTVAQDGHLSVGHFGNSGQRILLRLASSLTSSSFGFSPSAAKSVSSALSTFGLSSNCNSSSFTTVTSGSSRAGTGSAALISKYNSMMTMKK